MEQISLEKARAKLGGLVHDAQNGTSTVITRNGKPAAMITPLTRLTDADRALAARACNLAGLGQAALSEHTGETDTALAYACAFGEARYMLAELAAIIARLDGHAAAQPEEDNHG